MPAPRRSDREPAWHRNLRRARAKARQRLHCPELLHRSLLERSADRLRHHHGSRVPRVAMAMLDRTGNRCRKFAAEADQCQIINNSQWTDQYLPNVGFGMQVGPSGSCTARHWSPEQEAQARFNASRTPVPRRLSPQQHEQSAQLLAGATRIPLIPSMQQQQWQEQQQQRFHREQQ